MVYNLICIIEIRKGAMRMPSLSKRSKLSEVIRGSLVIMKRVCGKKNCKCVKGYRHESLYISQGVKGKTRMIYVPRSSGKKVRQYVEHYHEIKKFLDESSKENIKKLYRGIIQP
ncbi:MAG: hypothetical protein HYS07_09300 [Chlamydiae bacterium]|nr:hypothetical protein [Chlamydiota bacterium]